MAKTTTVRIVNSSGVPLPGVSVVASDKVSHWVTTDEQGQLSMQFDDDEVFCSLIAVKLQDGTAYCIHLLIEAGDTREAVVPGA